MNLIDRQIIAAHQVFPDVLADRYGLLAPVGHPPQQWIHPEHPVGRCHKGKAHFPVQHSAQERRNPGMGMDHIRLLLANHLFQSPIGPEHHLRGFCVRRNLKMSNSIFFQRFFIDAAIGCHQHLPATPLQGQGQLHHMGFRAANLQSHQNHEYFLHAFIPHLPG